MKSIRSALGLVPGILLLVVIGYSGKLLEKAFSAYGKSHGLALPNIEYVLWAILIGLLIANTMGVHRIFKPGVATYEFFLKIGIIFLGSRFLIVDVLKLGGISLVLVAVELGMSIVIMTWIGKKLGLSQKLTSLLAVGSSICGVSAIIAAKGAIDASEEDSSIAITAILTVGALSLFVFPLVGHWLFLDDRTFGMWVGLAVDNTAEAVAAGALYSESAGKVAALAKTARNATIGFVVLGYALYYAKQGLAQKVGNKAVFLWEKFPKFVLGFLVVSLLASAQVFDKGQLTSLGNLSRWAFLLTFAGVGLNTDFRAMWKQGAWPFVAGIVGELLIAVVTLGLVVLASNTIGL
ncbi:MAG: putative sulfate exporter family transporter [Candidatus Kaiserbacteria bacterium]|nr:putative sulfate exporter family transporter [Candidatus Kaiserbacteria bacterium]